MVQMYFFGCSHLKLVKTRSVPVKQILKLLADNKNEYFSTHLKKETSDILRREMEIQEGQA